MTKPQPDTAPHTPDDGSESPMYGFRYRRHEAPSGEEWRVEMLTLEDVLHPQVGDFVVHTDYHQRHCIYLYNVVRARCARDTTALVLHDTLVDWGVPNLRPVSPDLTLVYGVTQQRNWATFSVTETGVRPVLVIEVTSPEYRDNDLVIKRDYYHEVGVPFYLIVDFYTHRNISIRRIIGYRWSIDGYQPLTPNDQGWLWVEPLGLWLGINGDMVELYEPSGEPVADYIGVVAALAATEAAAEAERTARLTAEATAQAERAAAAAERTARLTAEATAQAERAAAAAERTARLTAEGRIAALEAELRQMRGAE